MKAILVDDEQMAVDFLEHLLKKNSDIDVIDKLTNPLMVRKKVQQLHPDVVFLDIEMPQVDGLELAEQLLSSHPFLQIVFVTAYNQHAVRAFEINALDYLLKPFSIQRLNKTVERLVAKVNGESKSMSSNNSLNNTLQINVCGSLSLTTSHGEKEVISWRTLKAKELFLYLLHNKEKLVQKSFLIELLWPDLDPEKAYAQLYTAVYHVRNVLKKYPSNFKIINTKEGYTLSTQNITIDIQLWKEKLELAPPMTINSIDRYVEIMDLYKGSYLEEHGYWWAENHQLQLEQVWLDYALKIAYFYWKEQSYQEAKKWFKKVCDSHPENEEAHFILLKIYATTNDSINVERHYQNLKEFLHTEFGTKPHTDIRNWYSQWKKYN
ncbi:response regulator [Agaribacter marinus]|uniref:Response regulator n=1 Tax=Virgibacillus salarius TaxID=447199 RepID=A0A941DS89_9BACI|nr:response regulator [uncultured Virgibacillus sp.]MBR7794426.1 response regulator [Virgibacillus salarius]NAZ07150.1 response regulator [Agaribacter marinus]